MNRRKIRTWSAIFFILGVLCYLIYNFPRPLFNQPLSTIVFDKNEALLGARIAPDGQWRIASADTLPDKYCQALILAEDHRFHYHPGIDPISLFAAISDKVSKGKKLRGASTIPMQIMRMAMRNNQRSISAKIKESIYAVYLTLRYSKRSQLKLYANHAPFGGNVVGIEAACWRYYGKSPDLLSWAEAATLAILPNAPSLITLSKNKEQLKIKRDRLLWKLCQHGHFDKSSYELFLLEELPDEIIAIPSENRHLVDRLSKMPSEDSRYYTTIDGDIQSMCREISTYHNEALIPSNVNNIAILVLDNDNGEVLAYIGNTLNKVNGHAVDIIQAPRSSGSILKPILATALFDRGSHVPKSLVNDAPIYINGYAPVNFDNSFRGLVSIEEALQRSLNIPFVSLLKDFHTARFQELCTKAGITTLRKSPDHYGLSLILGGGEVTLWDITGMYSSMARTLNTFLDNDSKYQTSDWHQPKLLAEEYFHETKSSFDYTHFSAGSIHQCFEAMTALKRPSEEGMWEEFSSSKKIAWKTGTSFGNKDAWAIGVNKKYTVGVWLGNANGNSRSNIIGVKIAAPVLFDVFNRLPTSDWFKTPFDDLTKRPICTQSGYLASTNCPSADTIFISASGKNLTPCKYHKSIFVDKTYQFQVLADCYPTADMMPTAFLDIPPHQLVYYVNHHPEYKKAPPFHEACKDLAVKHQSPNIAIIYPQPNAVIHPVQLRDGSLEKIVLRATNNLPDQILYWHINDEYIGTTTQFHTKEITLKPGKFAIVIMDDKGHKVGSRFEIK